jgi:hypothetical protein
MGDISIENQDSADFDGGDESVALATSLPR